ncbi:hypothetical protein [Paraburkholderia youngii]|uniref:hypothetical protein n=1 Tax=Paraburkholderia youngii TaxID=2782701 RepID=UPI003D1C354D
MNQHKNRAGKALTLAEALAADWAESWPTYLAEGVPVSEGAGTIEGGRFCFWLGSSDPGDVEVTRKIAAFIMDHDVVAIRFVRALPIKVHPAIEAQYEASRRSPEANTSAANAGVVGAFQPARRIYFVADERFNVTEAGCMLREGFIEEGEAPAIEGIFDDADEAERAARHDDPSFNLDVFPYDYDDQMTLTEIRMFFGC